jgi:hypothetical protein
VEGPALLVTNKTLRHANIVHPMSQRRDMGHPVICGWSDLGHPPIIVDQQRLGGNLRSTVAMHSTEPGFSSR